jgi:hypothetical protein
MYKGAPPPSLNPATAAITNGVITADSKTTV